MLRKILAITSLLMAFQAPMIMAAEENGLTAIGLDENGKEIEFPMGTRIWKKKVTKVLKRVGGGVIPGLDNTIQSAEKFKLGQVDVGLYVKMKIGIADIVSASLEPYFKLYFKK